MDAELCNYLQQTITAPDFAFTIKNIYKTTEIEELDTYEFSIQAGKAVEQLEIQLCSF